MRSSSTTGIVREERSKTVSKPHHYSHLKLPPLRNRTANKTPGNFPTVVAHKPSGTCHRSFFLWERSNLSCNRGSSGGRTNVREVRVLEFAWWIKGHLSGFILRFLLINALGHCMKLQGMDIVFESLDSASCTILDSASCTILDSASCTFLVFLLIPGVHGILTKNK
jgi:hypothetical protein